MEQAGINKLYLVEAKNLTLRYDVLGNVDSIAGDGAFIEISADFQSSLEIKEARNRNGKVGYSYELSFIELEASVVQSLTRSIYGFIPVFNMNTLDQQILTVPLLFDKSNQDNNVSASYSTKISNFVTTDNKLVHFNNTLLEWILGTGFWNDEAYWVDSAIWID